MRTVAIIKINGWIGLSDLRPGQSHRRDHGMSNLCGAHICIVQRFLIVRYGFPRPGKIEHRRRVVFADFIGPEFGVGMKNLIAADTRIPFEINVRA